MPITKDFYCTNQGHSQYLEQCRCVCDKPPSMNEHG